MVAGAPQLTTSRGGREAGRTLPHCPQGLVLLVHCHRHQRLIEAEGGPSLLAEAPCEPPPARRQGPRLQHQLRYRWLASQRH